MRFMFVAGGGDATVFTVAPLAHAARLAGHQVLVGAPEEASKTVVELGLPTIAVCDLKIVDAMLKDRDGNAIERPDNEKGELEMAGRGFGRLAAATVPALTEAANEFRPDLIVGGAHTHAAALVSHDLGVPFVRQAWDLHERSEDDWRGATLELGPELSERGLTEIPEADMFLDFTPPQLQPEDAEPSTPMRFVPGNSQRPLEAWMLAKQAPSRVLVTSGSRASMLPSLGQEFFDNLLKHPLFNSDEVEVVVATTEPIAEYVRENYPNVKAGWIPLDVVAPTADVVVHHGGGVTSLTVLSQGVPQVCLPEMLASAIPVRRIEDLGAAIVLESHTVPAEEVADAVNKILSSREYSDAARELAGVVASQPGPSDIVAQLEAIAASKAAIPELARA